MTDSNEPAVVDLVDAGLPADQGLSSLGMLMQLAGNVFAALAALLVFSVILMPGESDKLVMIVVLGLCMARSFVQRSAGAELLYGKLGASDPAPGLAGLRRYVRLAGAQSVVVPLVMTLKFHMPVKYGVAIAMGLGAWPATLAILLALPRFRRFSTSLPIPEDKGFEGASILMTVLGLVGLAGGATALLAFAQLPGKLLQQGGMILTALAVAMLVIRSAIHVRAGLAGLRETSVDVAVERANQYANFGVISAFCAGGALLITLMTGPGSVAGLTIVAAVSWMLMAWPLVIRRFFSERQFADLLAGPDAPIHRRAPDAGLTALGWLLLGYGVYSASFVVPSLIVGADARQDEMVERLLSVGGAMGVRSIWWSIGQLVLQIWAGVELVRMSKHSRPVASAFGVVGTLVGLYVAWPQIEELRHMTGMAGGDAMFIGPLALSLILPVATLVLVNRKIAPAARARFRDKPPEPRAT